MSALRQRPVPTRGRGGDPRSQQPPPPPPMQEIYNIIPVHDLLADHPSHRYPEVRAVSAALLRPTLNLPKPPFVSWDPRMDLMDWLGVSFGFQKDNVRNQREHLVLHLANSQMRLQPPPTNPDELDPTVLRGFRKKLLQNYTLWCSFLGVKPHLHLSTRRANSNDLIRELLYVSLYLLIWGEAGNLRFCPELLSYIFHHMAMELNKVLKEDIDEFTGRPYVPSISGDCAFLKCIVMPFYRTIKTEVESSRNGTAPHSAWRNYDDINEYFWSKRCFRSLKWPIDYGSNFFDTAPKNVRVGKTGFVEQRSFWNVFRSFDRLWILLILFFQASIIVAWTETKYPWDALARRDVQVELLTVFITWAGLRLVQSVLDAGTQYSLVSRETLWLGIRMVLKSMAALTWIVVFAVFYKRIWSQKNDDGQWSREANGRIITFLEAVFVFIIPELLSLLLFVIPWVRNWIEGLDWMVVSWLTWWFHTRIFVGRGLREGLVDNIRSMEQLRLRFQFFASAMQFNLMPEDQLLSPKATLVRKLRDAIHLLKLRYGLGQPYKKIESSQVEATRFALIWNEIVISLREEDLISDREVELMELPPNCWNIRVIRWPCVLLCNELLLALSQAEELADAPDIWLWLKICKNEYGRCSVIEAYDSVKYLLLTIVKYGTEEYSIVLKMFQEIDLYVQEGKLTSAYKMAVLPKIHDKLASLVDLLVKQKNDPSQAVNLLQALYELCIREFPKMKRSIAQLREGGLAPRNPGTDEGLLFENAINFPDAEDADFYKQLRRLQTILTSKDSMHNIPLNFEARRRIAFFSNSLFMNMPHAPNVEKMMAFSVLTPYYDEEVLYKKGMLQDENEDGISTLFYLQKIYEDEWMNFMERMRREGMDDDDDIWKMKLRDLRLWASYRGQTLSRTVRGMMYYYRALKMLSFLDSASEMDIRTGTQEISSHLSLNRNRGLGDGIKPPTGKKLDRAVSGVSLLFKGHEYGCALMKFTYVVTCQLYGRQKARGESHAEEILYLMKMNEALRVAYVDEVQLGRDEVEYYSVLVKYDQELQREVEIYRIRLPGPLKLGEGKPENQNHAIIFTRGDAIQTIDMNQDNYFEEALKMRNLLEEFKTNYGIRKPTILGVRENVFTGSVSSLAWFMSAQETSFVTLGQRVLANPLKVRMHYGHPDVFDRFWFLTRGGISKASRVINISEDIFAGFNCTLRGGNVTHHEYIQVGKGRDVGLNQISMFEAKVASGNGEQVLSRDVYRLGHRLDFFRMFSFFYTTVGHYFNTMMVVLTVYTFLWGRLYFSLSGVEREAKNNSVSNEALGAILNQQFIIQLGLFTALPMVVENSLEHGFLPAVWDFLKMQLQLASFFFTFSMGTRSHFFGRTILHGGAKYRATGRGFVVEHKSFAENYRLYARSHFVKAIELGVILAVYAFHSPLAKDTFVYIAMTISSWFLVVSWIMSPFVFNPSGFDWLKTVYDFDDFMNWLWYKGGVFTEADKSWEIWWYEEQGHLRTTGLWGKLLEIILDLRFFFFQYGLVYQLNIAEGRTSIAVYLLSWIYMIVAVGIYVVIAYAQDKYAAKQHIYYRIVQLVVTMLTVLVIVLMLEFTNLSILDLVRSLMAFIPTGWGLISIAQVLRPFLQSTVVWDTVVSLARLYDLLFGVIVIAPVALLSWLPGFQSMQTRILFNEGFSRGLQISRILTGKKSVE
ncbi:Glycosyl transferase, family 48 [Corchorus capsularis]|uniref:1,3-beta-glucan synthase n=1 Tax=Corchorus capsularis TaxID=210143 RepID=A0A1R3I1H0_COCAP|nr:Glycosyl transferase, family 48 [Corchorus capsularis]